MVEVVLVSTLLPVRYHNIRMTFLDNMQVFSITSSTVLKCLGWYEYSTLVNRLSFLCAGM